MATIAAATGTALVLQAEGLAGLVAVLQQQGFEVVAPVARDGAVVYAVIESAAELASGWTAETAPGRYRLIPRADGRLFGAIAAQSPKPFLHPAEFRVFSAERDDGPFRILPGTEAPPKRAFLGVRPCDLAAIAVQDRVLLEDRHADWVYRRRREGAFLVALHCTEPAATCFCASMGSGPHAGPGYDIVLTEMVERGHAIYLAEAGTERGAKVLEEAGAEKASDQLCRAAAEAVGSAAGRMQRAVDTSGIRELLYDNFDHPRWEATAERCLSCGNCTLACPTCFCVTYEDGNNVEVTRAWRVRKWDSCFTHSFSYIHGGSVRLSAKSRYRQWLTHKFAAWTDQFGSSGCVGCGRCITWCPVGIDITEELAALRGEPAGAAASETRA